MVVAYAYGIKKPAIFTTNKAIAAIMPSYTIPLFFLNIGFLQSTIPLFTRGRILNEARKRTLKLCLDEAEINVDIFENSNGSKTALNVVLVPGLHGTSRSRYVVDAANFMLKKYCRVFVIHARGVLGLLKSNRYSHVGHTEDLLCLTEHIIGSYTNQVFFIGFSQGANVVTKFLGEFDSSRIVGGISVCNPFNFKNLENLVLTGGICNRIGHRAVVYVLKKHLHEIFPNNLKFNMEQTRISKLTTCTEVTAKLIEMDFIDTTDIETFLHQNSSEFYIEKIKKPFLFINAVDDPIIPEGVIPKQKILKNSMTGLITLHGGHLGFKSFFMTSTLETIMDQFAKQLKLF
ncbi:ABHD2 [Enterospora canceri]|uniref:ABHD2 n=1 Tax=Enterospora canceri TaxID=1081671 RepID=A0A1Y1S5J5_9MICR|nr:ABHD2 [Enterospora canceri]